MRVYAKYEFHVGRKIEFKQLMNVVDSFLAEHGLTYSNLCYDFRSSVYRPSGFMQTEYGCEAEFDLFRQSACHKISRAYPCFGDPLRVPDGNFEEYCLNNFDEYGIPCDTNVSEELLRLVWQQIPRPYNFTEETIVYDGVDFFARTTPVIPEKAKHGFSAYQRKSSNILVTRHCVGPQTTELVMTIDISDGCGVLNAEAYAKAMHEILGKPRQSVNLDIAMDEEEMAIYSAANDAAAICVEELKEFVRSTALYGDLNAAEHFFRDGKNYKVSKTLKKIAADRGFNRYAFDPLGCFVVRKRTAEGHRISLQFDLPPGCKELRPTVAISGLGFYYYIDLLCFCPQSQTEADACIERSFDILEQLEKTHIQQILALYPNTPDWYVDRDF